MLSDRFTHLQAELKNRQIDCMVLIPGYNLRYVTGLEFHLMERATIFFIPAEAPPVFVLPGLEQSKVTGLSIPGLQCFTYADGQDPAGAMVNAAKALPEIHTLAVE